MKIVFNLIFCLFCAILTAQTDPIQNFRWDVSNNENNITILFDLSNLSPCYNIIVQVITPDSLLYPKSLTGDYGHPVRSGPGKRVNWSWKNDLNSLNGEVVIRTVAIPASSCNNAANNKNEKPPYPVGSGLSFKNFGFLGLTGCGLIAKGVVSGLKIRNDRAASVSIINEINRAIAANPSNSNLINSKSLEYDAVIDSHNDAEEEKNLTINAAFITAGLATLTYCVYQIIKSKSKVNRKKKEWEKYFALRSFSTSKDFTYISGTGISIGINLNRLKK